MPEIDVGCQVTSQCHRTYFGCVGNGESLENTPGDTAEDFTGEQSLDVGSREEDGGKGADQKETGHEGITVSEAFRSPSIDEKTDDFSSIGAIAKTRLPL